MKTRKRAPKTVARHKAKIKARRPAHKKFLLHPATVFLMLCVGILLIGSSLTAKADTTDTASFGVHGRVPAEPLTEPAVITNPSAGTTFSAIPITVKGSCPDNSYVKLYRNDLFSGVALCSGGQFSLESDLFVGNNDLLARVFNVTDDEGPLGSTVRVVYAPPQPVTLPENPNQHTPPVQPFVLKSDYENKGYTTGQKISWTLGLSGGTPPYAIHVDWGDKKSDTLALKDDSDFIIEHTYTKSGTYIIKLDSTDGAGAKAMLQLVAIVNSAFSSSSGFASITTPPAGGLFNQISKWLWVAWPAYGIVALMTFSFWLGEKQELIQLMRSSTNRRRHA